MKSINTTTVDIENDEIIHGNGLLVYSADSNYLRNRSVKELSADNNTGSAWNDLGWEQSEVQYFNSIAEEAHRLDILNRNSVLAGHFPPMEQEKNATNLYACGIDWFFLETRKKAKGDWVYTCTFINSVRGERIEIRGDYRILGCWYQENLCLIKTRNPQNREQSIIKLYNLNLARCLWSYDVSDDIYETIVDGTHLHVSDTNGQSILFDIRQGPSSQVEFKNIRFVLDYDEQYLYCSEGRLGNSDHLVFTRPVQLQDPAWDFPN